MGELHETVTSGDRVRSLERLRDHLAYRLERAVDERIIAPVAKQLADVMAELAKLNPPKQESKVDDLATKRAARRKGTAVSKRSGGAKQRGSGSGRADGGRQATS